MPNVRWALVVVAWSAVALAQASAAVETPPLTSGLTAGGDVAVWLGPGDGGGSLVFGVDRTGAGLQVYRLDGGLAQVVNLGPTLGVDVRQGVRFSDGVGDVVAVATSTGTVRLYAPRGEPPQLQPIEAMEHATQSLPTALSLGRLADGGLHVYVGDGTGRLLTYRKTNESSAGALRLELVKGVDAGNAVKALAFDDRDEKLYVLVAGTGVWRHGAEPDPATASQVVPESSIAQGVGASALAVYPAGASGGHLLVANALSSRFHVYVLGDTYAELNSFRIIPDAGREGASGSQGVEALSRPVGPQFPGGLLVVHDAHNPEGPNYKLVAWHEVAATQFPRLSTDLSYDPRQPLSPRGASVDAGRDAGLVCVPADAGPDASTPDGGDAGVVCFVPDAGRPVDPGSGPGGQFPSTEPSPCGCGHVPVASAALLLALGLLRRRSRQPR